MSASFGYILRNRAFRDNSRLLDVFTEDYGRIPCIARPAKKRGKILAGTLEPLRYLHLQWIGRGEVMTLTQADERGRHDVPVSELLKSLYINELVLRLTLQHHALPELFIAYKKTLHRLTNPTNHPYAISRFELYLLQVLGVQINLFTDDEEGKEIEKHLQYSYVPQYGVVKADSEKAYHAGFLLSGRLIILLRDLNMLQFQDWQELRIFLDKLITFMVGKPLNTRKLIKL